MLVGLMRFFSLYFLFSLCGATEYFVRPTEPTDTSCPAQPCLTLSQYISNSDLYFKSNTVFKFLPGLHHANQTLDMRNVENVSLEAEQNSNHPILIVDIHCSSHDCAGFHFHNITNLTIHSLNFSVFVRLLPTLLPNIEELSVSGFMYSAVNTLQMYYTSVQLTSSPLIPSFSGITVFTSEQVLLHSLTTICGNDSVGTVGIFISSSQYVSVSSTVVMYAQRSGILITSSNIIDIVNTEVSYSGQFGLGINFARHITVTNSSVTESFEDGILVVYSINVTLFNMSVVSSGSCVGKTQDVNNEIFCYGIFLTNVRSAVLFNIIVLHFEDNAIDVSKSSSIAVENATLTHVGGGITSSNSFRVRITCATISNFSKSGISLLKTQFTVITNVTVTFTRGAVMMGQSREDGISVWLSQYTFISSAVVKHAEHCGLSIHSSWLASVPHTVLIHAQYAGICLRSSVHAIISGAIVLNTEKSGVFLKTSNDIDIVNTTVLYSGQYGLDMDSVHHMRVTNTSVTESYRVGMYVTSSTNIAFLNTSVMYSGTKRCVGTAQMVNDGNGVCCGLFLGGVGTAQLYNIRVMYSGNIGIGIFYSPGITVKNTTVTHVREGILSLTSPNIHISFTTICNFSKSGINVFQTQYSVISNVTIFFTQYEEVAIDLYNSQSVQIESISLVPNSQGGTYEVENAVDIISCSEISISKSVFKNFKTPLFHNPSEGQPTVFILSSSSNIYFSDCTFEGNNITGLVLVNSHFTVVGNLSFVGNRAYKGAAIVFLFASTMRLPQNGSVYFVNNSAAFKGGAIYLGSSNSYGYSSNSTVPECFLQVEQPDVYTGLTFVNNSAGQGGDALYGRIQGFNSQTKNNDSLNCSSHFEEVNDDFCSLVELASEYYVNCSFLFKDVSSITPNTLSQVASDPVRVCICNNDTPECNIFNITVNPIFPGQSFSISTVVTGEELGTVAGSVFANFLSLHSIRPQLARGEDTQEVTQLHCNRNEYTIFSINSTEVLVLTSDSVVGEYTDPTSFTRFPVYVNIILLPCPPGFALMEASARCDCSPLLQQLPGVSCNIKDQTIHRSGLVWVGSVKDENQTVETVITAKYCPLNYCKREDISVDLNQPDTQCEFNHSGILCGGCQPGLSLKLGGVQCGVCSNKNVTLIIPFLLAGVVLVFFLKISNLTTSEGFINSLVFYASIVKANEHIFLPQANTNPLTLFISWLNLDLGVQTCFFNGLNAYTKIWLQFVFPFYIWSITGVIIISARYSTRIARLSGNNSVPVLATLFLLSYAKLLGIIITSLSYTVLEYPGGQKVVWSADGNIDYLGAKHAALFVAAVATLLFLWLPYTVLLFTGQWLYKCKLSIINRMLIKLKPFLDAH